MKKTDFLNYVSSLIDSKDYAYYDENEQYFYFYHDTFMFSIKSNPGAAFLVITDHKSGDKLSETISLSSEEAIDFVEKLIKIMPTNHDDYMNKKVAIGIDYFNDCVNLLDEYLKNYNPVLDIEKYSSSQSLENYVMNFPLDGINHICRLGRTAKYNEKKQYLLTSVVKIPFYLLDSNDKKSGSIPYDLIVPSWKIKDYPILSNFVEPKIFGTDFDETFQNMIKKFPHGKAMFKEVLDSALPLLNRKIKPTKI